MLTTVLDFWCVLAVAVIVALATTQPAGAAGDFEFVRIYRAARGRSAMYAQLTPLRDGAMLCTFRDSEIDRAGQYGKKGSPWTVPGSRIVCIRSADGGRTWSKEPAFIYRDPDNSAYTSQGGCGYQAKDGTILVPFYVVTMTHEGTRTHIHWNFMASSRDGGLTWACRRLPSEPFLSNPQYGGIKALADGRLWRVERCRGYGIAWDEAQSGKKSWLDVRSCVRILESRDEGRTWSVHSYVGYDPTRSKATARFPTAFKEDEPALIRLPSGRILLIARPYLYQAASADEGRTWRIGPSTLTRKGATSGLCPALAHSTAGPPGDTLVLAYHDRWGEHERKGGVYLAFSHDEGDTWGHPTFLDAGAYPCLYETQAGSGRVLCAYYRSSRELKGAFFALPFPTGLRAAGSAKNQRKPCITVEWDPYRGRDAEAYEYRVYRSEKAGVGVEPKACVFSCRNASSYRDEDVAAGRTYHYRVAAWRDGGLDARSWEVSARAR